MKKIIIIGLILLIGLVAKSQKYMYSYDNNGNRIKREFIPFKITKDTVATDSTANITDSATVAATNQAAQQQQQCETMLGEQKITVYPNPTKGELTIDISNFKNESQGMILLTDMQGRILFKNENINSANTLNLSSTAFGNYILKILIDGKSNEWIIVKE